VACAATLGEVVRMLRRPPPSAPIRGRVQGRGRAQLPRGDCRAP
jgi:hypothetical protein